MSILRIEKLIKFLKERFEDGIQMFDTPSMRVISEYLFIVKIKSLYYGLHITSI